MNKLLGRCLYLFLVDLNTINLKFDSTFNFKIIDYNIVVLEFYQTQIDLKLDSNQIDI